MINNKRFSETLINLLFSSIRIILGISWLKEGLFKFQSNFDMTGLIPSVEMNRNSPDWFKSFMTDFVSPNIDVFNILIPTGELLVGIGLLIGIWTLPVLLIATFMNINYWLSDMIYIYPYQIIGAVLLLSLRTQNEIISFKTLIRYLITTKKMKV